MNRSHRRVIQRLTVSLHPWEVALVDVGITVQGAQVEGMVVVVEQSSGRARTAAPLVRGESLASIVARACTSPAQPCRPERPSRLLCADPALAARLTSELHGLRVPVVHVGRVPRADDLAASLAEWLAAPPVPGMTVELALWASTLTTLCRLAPWRVVTDSVTFRFAGSNVPALTDAVAVVLGNAGEQRGVALFATARDHESFVRSSETEDYESALACEARNLYIDPIDEFEPDELARCVQAGLVIDGRWCPRLLAVKGGHGRPVSDQDQRVLLAAIEGIVGLCAGSDGRLEYVAATTLVSTCLGRLEVRSAPAESGPSEPLLADADHAWSIGTMRALDGTESPALVIKLRKPDAERLGRSLAGVDRMTLEALEGGYIARVAAGSRSVGALVFIPATDVNEAPFHGATSAYLCVSAGGPTRPRIRPTDFVYMKEVTVS